jgi:putative NIF3 family GTP cyclohydrolase 1 type 2
VPDRRNVIASGAALALAGAMPARAAGLTVTQVLERMHGQIGTAWREGGVDRIITGSGDTPVRGIATTMMCTFDALKAAVAAKANLIITHEPTWWSHPDTLTGLENDPLYRTKLAYMRTHDLVSFHFGTAERLGWNGYRDPAEVRHYNLPPTTLSGLATQIKAKLNARTLRVIGDPALAVHRVVVSWGNCSSFPGIPFLDSDADVLLIGEAQDWDLIAYAQDLVAAGRKKGLIVVGHVTSEQWGMKYCADWLKGFVPEVPVTFLPLIEPYWNLRRPAFEINTRL